MCTSLYYRDQSAKLTIKSQKEREEKIGGMRQTKISVFIDFKPEVIDISKANIKCIEYNDGKDDLIAKTALDSTKNTLMQENVK